ncbi:MAG TPA: exodeoxyribonuclease VII large subunit [Vicinamibacterales bacterium]|nr:exodeoxyribonuclease VII large subunit [Vicinamibacterales bacterium]
MSDLFSLPFEEERKPKPGPPPPQRRVVTVSELTAAIRELLETGFGDIWVEGEISNCRLWNTGHMYFTLKDGAAQIKAVMFRSAVRYLKFKPEDGLRVVARGRLGLYDPKGEYQLVCEHLEPHGLGALQLAFEQLKKKLQAEGLFDQARKRALPSLPRKIGIVTSLEGAAIRDIIKVLRRRHPNAHLLIRPTRVQGDGAAADVAQAIRAIVKVPGVDVVIVGRGGGSIEDLQAFNQEAVARAIAASPVPIISAVGHESDVTIADFVADLRAPTPSAAAEMVVSAKDDFCSRIDRLSHRLQTTARAGLQRRRGAVHALTSRRGLAGWQTRLAMRGRHAAELTHHLRRAATAHLARRERAYRELRLRLESRDLRRSLSSIRNRLGAADSRLGSASGQARHRAESRLSSLAGRLENLSPLAVLARGYAVCWNADRTAIIRSASAVGEGDRVRVTLHEGEIECDVRRRE